MPTKSTSYSIEGSAQRIIHYYYYQFLFCYSKVEENALRPYTTISHLRLRLLQGTCCAVVHSVHESIRKFCPFAMRKDNNNMKETMTKNRQFSLCLPHNQLFILLRVQMSPNTSSILLHRLVCNRCIYISIYIRIFSRCFQSVCTLCEENGPC